MVYLDLSHKDPHELDVKLGGIIEIYEKFTGDDPRKVPMKIFPLFAYSMGSIYVDYDQMTNIKGLFAAGECDFSQHGGNRLGANSLLSAIYGGTVAGPNAIVIFQILIDHILIWTKVFLKNVKLKSKNVFKWLPAITDVQKIPINYTVNLVKL